MEVGQILGHYGTEAPVPGDLKELMLDHFSPALFSMFSLKFAAIVIIT